MRNFRFVAVLFAVFALSACVQTVYTKTVDVTKDANGKVLQVVEHESVTQPGHGWPAKFEYLKGVRVGE